MESIYGHATFRQHLIVSSNNNGENSPESTSLQSCAATLVPPLPTMVNDLPIHDSEEIEIIREDRIKEKTIVWIIASLLYTIMYISFISFGIGMIIGQDIQVWKGMDVGKLFCSYWLAAMIIICKQIYSLRNWNDYKTLLWYQVLLSFAALLLLPITIPETSSSCFIFYVV